MRRQMLIALVGLLSVGVTGSAGAATLDFTGTLSLEIISTPRYPALTIPAEGSVQLTDDGNLHLLSFLVPGGTFGPVTTTLPETVHFSTNYLAFTGIQNLSGSFAGFSGGPAGGGPMPLRGVAKICITFFDITCQYSYLAVPLTPTATSVAGFGVGGTQTFPDAGFGVTVATMQHNPWMIGQPPVMTIHTPNTTITTPVLPGGFAHGPASLTSSTAQPSGVVQLVTVSKAYSSLASFYEFPVSSVLTLHFVPEPGTLLLLGLGVGALAAAGRRRQ